MTDGVGDDPIITIKVECDVAVRIWAPAGVTEERLRDYVHEDREGAVKKAIEAMLSIERERDAGWVDEDNVAVVFESWAEDVEIKDLG